MNPNCIATVSLSGALDDKLRAAAEAGFPGVEIFDTDLVASALSPREIRGLLDELGLECMLYQPFRDFEGMPEPWRARAFDRFEQKAEVMRELGCRRLLLCSNTSPLASGDRDRIVADFRELGDRAAARDILIGYEALAWGRHVHDHRQVWEIVQAVDHPNVGILLDSFHSLARGIPNGSIRDIAPDKLVFLQLADAPMMDMGHLYWSRHFRNLPGQGDLDLTGYVAEILRLGYEGPLSLEIFNDRFRSSSASMVARDGVRALDALRDAAGRAIGRPAELPDRARIERVAFVEFTVDEADEDALSAMLRSVGFRRVGAHRSKRVELWRGGGVSFVLNLEPEGFAAAYRVAHGTSICAIGLAVADRAAAVQRARGLGVPEVASDIPAMPALRGVAGSLLYLLDGASVDALWTEEFDLDGDVALPEVGIAAIDHVAAVVHGDDFLSWQLYWRSLFEVDVRRPEDVIDPNGLVQSQALQNPEGTFRITLNSTDARDALSARFLRHSFGAGFQHVALRVDDMDAAAAELGRQGVSAMPVPANYHDDVGPRLGLHEAGRASMREAGILVDRDAEDNQYRQLYTRAFHKAFFFEFVERRGYDGYGAPNAPIRLAAQSRFRATETPD